jgi:hypothetical protein
MLPVVSGVSGEATHPKEKRSGDAVLAPALPSLARRAAPSPVATREGRGGGRHCAQVGETVHHPEAVPNSHEDGTDTYDIETPLGFLVHRLAETLEARLMARLAPAGLTLRAYRILAVLLKYEECRSVDLAERAGLEPPTVSRLVGALRGKRLVGRRPPPATRGRCASG